MTTNHDYNTPEAGATDWHIPLNDNFDRIDTDVEIRDTEPNRSTYEPKSGAKYLAIDTGAVFVGDGQQWTRLGSIRQLPGDVFVQDVEPDNPSEGDLWIDTGSQ